YFKRSGKYYTDGSYYSEKEWMHHIFDEVDDMKKNLRLPGLSSRDWDGIIHIYSDTHPNAYPGLIT
nr:hypothetical protein [Candidatus Methylopumilus sp.]